MHVSKNSSSFTHHLRVLYVFAGCRRRADIFSCLKAMEAKYHFELKMREFDILLNDEHDIRREHVWKTILDLVETQGFDVVICTPPCNTFSRARHAYKRHPGPRPIRSREWPRGFPWLEGRNARLAEEGNDFVDKMWELFHLCVCCGCRFLGEHPEDLGATDTGTPASIWQSEEFHELLLQDGVTTFALYQCQYGATTPKPTRFIASLQPLQGSIYTGIPRFASDGKYKGPLPHKCPHNHGDKTLIGMDAAGAWCTGPSAHYPPLLCEAIAASILQTCLSSCADGGGASSEDRVHSQHQVQRPSLEDPEQQVGPPQKLDGQPQHEEVRDLHYSEIQSFCSGPPLLAEWAGKSTAYVDGFGLCSPGRWHPTCRGTRNSSAAIAFANKLRGLIDAFIAKELPDLARSTFKLATGKYQQSPFSDQTLHRLRVEWWSLLENPRLASIKPDFQPFYLYALGQSLAELGDPDSDIVYQTAGGNFAEGVPVGHRSPLGPTPQVFRKRLKSPKYDESPLELERENYKSGSETERVPKEQFGEEEREGRMFPLSLKEARIRYPGNDLRIASQGVIDKPDGGHRIIHDATHGVNLNNEIVIEDRLENPGPKEMATITTLSMDAGERVLFGITADIAKARRRFVHSQCDWGVLACRANDTEEVVWLNRTGTFGVASASYWWSRLAGLLGRFVWRILERDWVFMLIYVDDLLLTAGGMHRWLSLWRALVCFEMLGVPFAYKKFI